MGAYLSKPITEKVSSDGECDYVRFGASSMQGWRLDQEDDHNSIIDYDNKSFLFAVYDGHGGSEVATYCAKKLPKYIKDLDSYKQGNISQALEDAFLGFDATLTTDDVVTVLKDIRESRQKKTEKDKESSSLDTVGGFGAGCLQHVMEIMERKKMEEKNEGENEISSLHAEASMPLETVIARYRQDLLRPIAERLLKSEEGKPLSPFLRAKRTMLDNPLSSITENNEAESLSSSTSLATEKVEPSTNKIEEPTSNETVVSKTSVKKSEKNGPCSSTTEDKHVITNGEVNGILVDESNGEAVAVTESPKKGKGKGKGKGSSGCSEVTTSPKKGESIRRSPRKNATQLYEKLLEVDDVDSEEDDEEDETFQGQESDSDSAGEEPCGLVDEEEEDEEEDDTEDSEDDESEDDEDEMDLSVSDEPGKDSGCTAVVALLRGNEMYVANAGDSRCVVCRDGKSLEMSLDHKPEDEVELNRITKAGGKVTADGRVNGGLNLSRAIGDHSYKVTSTVSAKEQMITALPDIRTITVDPEKDEFAVLACDGIWNSMTSDQVVEFVKEKIKDEKASKLSWICEELFDACLADTTAGDGTGCDNMTCIIIKFLPKLTDLKGISGCAGGGTKRAISEPETPTVDKRHKSERVDQECSSTTGDDQ